MGGKAPTYNSDTISKKRQQQHETEKILVHRGTRALGAHFPCPKDPQIMAMAAKAVLPFIWKM